MARRLLTLRLSIGETALPALARVAASARVYIARANLCVRAARLAGPNNPNNYQSSLLPQYVLVADLNLPSHPSRSLKVANNNFID